MPGPKTVCLAPRPVGMLPYPWQGVLISVPLPWARAVAAVLGPFFLYPRAGFRIRALLTHVPPQINTVTETKPAIDSDGRFRYSLAEAQATTFRNGDVGLHCLGS